MAKEPEQPAPAYLGMENRNSAMERRNSLMAEFLVVNPEVYGMMKDAVESGDWAARSDMEDAIVKRLSEKYTDLNEFEVTPEEKRLFTELVPRTKEEAVIKGAQKMFPKEIGMMQKLSRHPIMEGKIHPGFGKLPPVEEWVKVTPAVTAPLHSTGTERVINFIDAGLMGNLRAPKGSKEYIDNDLVKLYATVMRERTTKEEYRSHKNYNALRQRMGEQLAMEGISSKGSAGGVLAPEAGGFAQEKGEEFFRGMVPFIESFPDKPEWFPGADKDKQERVKTLMYLADEDTAPYNMAGKVAGLLAGGTGLYTKLGQMGLTRFVGTSNMQKVKSFLATATAEVGIDMAYNPNGYTMVLGALMDEDQNRVLSGIEAIALGTAFNLTIDWMQAVKGMKLKDAVKKLEDDHRLNWSADAEGEARFIESHATFFNRRAADVIDDLRKLAKGEKPEWRGVGKTSMWGTVSQMVDEAPIDIHIPNERRLAAMDELQESLVADAGVSGQAATFSRIDELEKLNAEIKLGLEPLKGGVTPKDAKLLQHKQAKNLEEIEVMKSDLGLLDLADQMKANQLTKETISRPPSTTPEEIARRIDLPERSAIDMEEWAEASEKTSRMREKGQFSRLAYREALMNGAKGQFSSMGISLLGGGLNMAAEDEDKIGAFMAGMMLPLSPWKTLKNAAHKFGVRRVEARGGFETLGYAFTPFVSQVDNLSESLGFQVAREAWRTHMDIYQKQETAKVFFNHMDDLEKTGAVSKAEKDLIYNSLDNGQRSRAIKDLDIIDRRIDPTGASTVTKTTFQGFEKVIRNIYKEAESLGMDVGFHENYFPRKISSKNYKNFLKEEGIIKDSRIKRAWQDEADLQGTTVGKLTKYEKAQIANTVVTTYGHGKGGKPGNAKHRHFDVVPPHLRKYYDAFENSQLRYIIEMSEAIHRHRWLGTGLSKNRLDRVVTEVTDPVTGSVIDKQVTTTRAPTHSGKFDYKKTIGKHITKAIEDEFGGGGKLTLSAAAKEKRIDRLTNLFHDRYVKPQGRPMTDWMKSMRDIGYMMTIGNPYSTITQFSDLMLTASLSERGSGATTAMTTYKKVASLLTGDKMTYTLADFGIDAKGLDRIMAELADRGATSKWLQNNLRMTGFSNIDVFGKEVQLNSTYNNLRKAARSKVDSNEFSRLVDEYGSVMGRAEFDDFLNALKQGNSQHPNVKFAVFQRLAKQHPILKDYMPLGYIKHPQARLMYSLKSFTIKQIDLLRQRTSKQIIDGLAQKNKRMVGDGIKDFLKYAILFGGSVQGVAWMKDFVLNREVSMSDRTVDWFMQLIGLHRFHVERIRRVGQGRGKVTEHIASFATGLIPPAAGILADSLAPDLFKYGSTNPSVKAAQEVLGFKESDEKMFEGKGRGNLKILGMDVGISDKYIPFLKAKSWRYVPLVGRDVFWSVGLGRDWVERRKGKGSKSSGKRSKYDRR